MPNSWACLIALVVSVPAFGASITLAPEPWACSRYDEELGERMWMTSAEHLAAIRLDHRRGVRLELMALNA